MAKLEIKLNEEARKRKEEFPSAGLSIRDYDILIDGHEPSHMTGIELSMNVEEINHATLNFFVDELDMDADFLTALKAEVENKQARG